MKHDDSRVISEPVKFIFGLLNVVITKYFFVFAYKTVKFIPCICVCMTLMQHYIHGKLFIE